MANETELANITHATDVASPIFSRALLEQVKVLPFVNDMGMPTNTNTMLVGKEGSVTAEAGSESTAYTFSANSEYTETEVSLTAVRTEVVIKNTVESQKFGGRSGSNDFMAMKAGEAIGRKLDGDVKTLFSGFSSSETATSTLTNTEIIDSGTTVRAALADDGVLVTFLDYKGIGELQIVQSASQAAIYANPNIPNLVRGYNGASGYVGEFSGLQLYATSGLPTDTGDDVGLTFNPRLAFVGIYDSAPVIDVIKVRSGGFWDEVSAYIFSDVAEWNDGAGCKVLSDT